MTGITFDKSVRFYRSFMASSLPVIPIDEIDEKQSEELVSFYTAKFDERGHLSEFQKYLNLEDKNLLRTELVFTDRYDYSETGQLTSRELVHADGKESHWFFEVREPDEIDGKTLLYAHNQLSEVQSDLCSQISNSRLSGREFAFEMSVDYLRSAERILQSALKDPDLRLLPAVILSDRGWLSLPPFEIDEMILKNFLAEFQTHVLQQEEFVCLPSAKLLDEKYPDGRKGFEELKIRAVAAASVRMSVDRKFLPVAILSVFGRSEWTDAEVEFLESLLNRIRRSLEGILEIGRRDEASQNNRQRSTSED